MNGFEKTILLAALSLGSVTTTYAAVSGKAETTFCSIAFGGFSANCTMKKTVELLGFDFDRLQWDCRLNRGFTPLKSKTEVVAVPSRPVGASWARSIVLKSHEYKEGINYCTYNKSYFFYNNYPDTQADVDAEHCLKIESSGDHEEAN